ncbi:MAG: hypothetical protein ABFS56_30840 [Pseudomonadota bacterium]
MCIYLLPPASVTELEIIHAIFSRLEQGSVTFDELANSTLFYMRDPAYIDKVPASQRTNFVNAAFTDKQTALKNRICDKGLPVTDYDDPEDLKNLVLRQMWHAINQRFPLKDKPSALEQAGYEREAFAESRTKIYIERPADLQRLDEHAAGDIRRIGQWKIGTVGHLLEIVWCRLNLVKKFFNGIVVQGTPGT